jgi:hypothetical protein
MSLRDAYREKLEAKLEEEKARLDLLKAQAKRAMAEGKIMGYEELADTEAKFDRMKARLMDFSAASGDAWKEMKDGLDKAWTELSEAGKRASARFAAKEKETAPTDSP